MRRPCDERACGCSDARLRATCVFIESRSPRLPDFVSPAWHRDRANPRSRVNFPEPPAEYARKPRLIRSRRESTNQKARFRRVPSQSRIVAKTDFHPCRPRPGKPQKCTASDPYPSWIADRLRSLDNHCFFVTPDRPRQARPASLDHSDARKVRERTRETPSNGI